MTIASTKIEDPKDPFFFIERSFSLSCLKIGGSSINGTHPLMALFFQILLALLLFYVVVCVWIYWMQEHRIFRPSSLHPDFDLRLTAPHKERWIEVEPGVSLNAVHLSSEDPKGLIIYHHGNSGDLSEWKDVASMLLPHGLDVLVYDYRGYGKSPGKIDREELLFKDGQRIYDTMKAEYDEKKIVLYGRSLGSAIASYLAAENDPALLLLETPFYSMKDLVFRYYPWLPHFLLLKYPLRNDLHLEKVSCPIHIFHGDRDRVVDHRSTQKLKTLLKSSDRFHTIEGGHHSDLSDFQEFHEALEEALGSFKPDADDQEGKVRSAS